MNTPKIKLLCHFCRAKKPGYSQWTECHHWQSGHVTDAEGHMTPFAPISDDADLTVPDGSDSPPPRTPLSRPCHPQLRGQNNKGEWGRAGQPTRYSETGRCATRERSETVTRTFYMHHLFPLCGCFECFGASLPQALHRPSTAHQGCGSHAHTLGDILFYFSPSLIFVL